MPKCAKGWTELLAQASVYVHTTDIAGGARELGSVTLPIQLPSLQQTGSQDVPRRTHASPLSRALLSLLFPRLGPVDELVVKTSSLLKVGL